MSELAWPLMISTLIIYAGVFAFADGNAFAELDGEFAETDTWDVGDLPDVIVAFFIDIFDLLTFGGIELHVLARVSLTVFIGVLWLIVWLK